MPVVTLPSSILAGKFSKTLYQDMQMSELIASDAHSYIYLALRLLTDEDFHSAMVKNIELKYQKYLKEDHNMMAAEEWLSFLETIFIWFIN